MLNSVLSGLIISIAAIWVVYAFNRLWQRLLYERAAAAITAAQQAGLTLQEAGYRPRLVASGSWHGQAVRLEWRGGVLGPRCVLRIDDHTHHLPLLTEEDQVQQLQLLRD